MKFAKRTTALAEKRLGGALWSSPIAGPIARPIARCLLPTAFCLLPTAYCLLSSAFCLPAAATQGVTLTGRIVLVNPSAPRKPVDNSNAVVWLTPVGSATSHAAGIEGDPVHLKLRLLQQHKRFEPHVLVVPVGSTVDFPNLDPFFHNVFSLFEGKRFDLGLYEAGATQRVKFDRPGVCYIFCNIHPEMSAVVVVVKTNYYAISDSKGKVAIPSVPPGRYILDLWYERSLPEALKAFPREVTVSEIGDSIGTIRLIESGDLMPSHKNKYGRDYDKPTPAGPLYEQP